MTESTMEKWERNEFAFWEAKVFSKEPHDIMIPHIQRLLQDQAQRYNNFQRLIAAYEYGPRAMSWDSRDDKNIEEITMAFNYARAAVETVVTKTVKSTVTPQPFTLGGSYDDRENAEKLGQAIDGEFKKNRVAELFEDVVVDGYTLGNGFFYVPHGQGEVRIEFLPCEDVVVDEAECRYRAPRSVFVRFVIDRDKLLAIYGKADDAYWGSITNRRLKIRNAAMINKPWSQRDRLHNGVEVWLGWHLRSGEDADDGKFCVCIEGCTLEFSDWDRDRFPLAGFVPYKRRRHYHGLSMLADLLSPQCEHDKVTERIQMANHRIGGVHLLVNRRANIEERELSNGQGTAVYHDDVGAEPVKELHPEPASEAVIGYRKGLVDEMMAVKGVPSMTMTGQVPEGLHGASGKAIESAEEQMAERLILQQNAKDRVLVDLAWLVIEEAEAIVEDKSDYAVNVRNDVGLESVKWKDVLLARDRYELDVQPVGDLAQTPSAKFEQLMRMADANRITNDEFREMWFMPDLKALNDIDLSDTKIVLKLLTKMVKTGKQFMPENFDNVKLALVVGRKFYNMARVNDVPEDRLQLIRDYLDRAKTIDDRNEAIIAARAPKPAGPPAHPPGAPPAPQQAAAA